jgi:acyl-coenzyme A thioesterase PaaI-like protein
VLRCSYWLNEERSEAWLVADVGRAAGNMAGVMMGGASATLLDQGCGLLFSSRHRGATAYLNIQYHAPAPVPSAVLVRATLDRVEGRKLWISARLQSIALSSSSAGTTNSRLENDDDGHSDGCTDHALPPLVRPEDLDALTMCATTDALFIARRAEGSAAEE